MSSLPARDSRARPGGVPRPSRLPSSDELFRRTAPRDLAPHPEGPDGGRPYEAGIHALESPPPSIAAVASSEPSDVLEDFVAAERRPSRRERHDEKITVYVSSEELIDLDGARLTLQRLGIKADRGRVVREALAELISDLERNREAAVLVRRLRAE